MIIFIHKSSEGCSARSLPLIKTRILYPTAGPRPSDNNVRFVQRIILTTVLHKLNVPVICFPRRKSCYSSPEYVDKNYFIVTGIMQQFCNVFFKMYVYLIIYTKRYSFGYNAAMSSWHNNDIIITSCVLWVGILFESIISKLNVFTTGSCKGLSLVWHEAIT